MNLHILPDRVKQSLHEHGLCPGDTIIVALSGGADSCALLDILAGLKELSLHLIVAHLNHCLRGAESDTDEEFCRGRAEHYALPFKARRIDVGEMARLQKINLEDAGRQARHQFLEEVRLEHDAAVIALAHHADDQAETVLMRLLRGAGTTGLSGMSWRNGNRLRPLLDSTRVEIEAYLAERNLCFREDLSNRDTKFLRNRVRHELLPLLETYNPAIRSSLTTTASLLSDEDAVLEDLTAKLVSEACRFTPESVSCDLIVLVQQPPALLRRLLRHVLERLHGSLKHFGFRHIQALEHLICSPRPNARLNLPVGTCARRSYDLLVLERLSKQENLAGGDIVSITGPGVYRLPWGGTLILSLGVAAPPDAGRLNQNIACFDLEKVPFPWQVRTFRSGDRMTPLGMTGSKKVKDIFIDAKIPLPQRRRLPLVFCGTTLIWLCGLRTSQKSLINDQESVIIIGEYSAT
ncbi:tRNA lysidine(34) synthetase TilS [Pelotalea chapellei]|uniref:tRNA(Ile)-lysidine synthase n=1 Tax=Pelotalea chapellei TaxID=44671 RepID=A0ABS5U4A3_9BACT|nr:tRNA lysidine(34) synthetase TilS [Pelotalea chapellei]